MKRLILILGANGIGKSTASAELFNVLPNSAYIDSDSLHMINTGENAGKLIAVQKANILAIMRNYFAEDFIEYVIFPYGYHGHRKKMLGEILDELKKETDYKLCTVLLTCEEHENIRRMKADGRDDARIKRAIENTRMIFEALDCPEIDITTLTPEQTAVKIKEIIRNGEYHGTIC